MAENSFSRRWRLAQFLELRWWKRYLRGRSAADYLAGKRTYWDRVFQELRWRVEPGVSALDAGCGPAGVFISVGDRQRVTALDPLLGQYETLEVFSASRYPHVNFLCLPLEDAADLPAFDVIYCFNAINHVSDWARSLDALTALARPGTRMILTSDVHRHRWLLSVFRALPGDALHPQQHPAEDYRLALSRRGWQVEQERELRKEWIFSYRAWVCEFSPAG